MIVHLSLWRVMAWIGAGLCGRSATGEEGSGRWQDKSRASRWDVGAQNCKTFRATRLSPRLALIQENHAFPPCNEPAANHLPLRP